MLQPLGLIVAFSKNHCIGINNGLPWHYSEDLKRFRKITNNHIIIMGRKTHESIGKTLPKRRNIIISHDKFLKIPGCEIYQSLNEAMVASKTGEFSEKIPIIIGGSSIYKQSLPYVTRMWLTVLDKHYDGDSFFPHFDPNDWVTVESELFPEFKFKTLERKNTHLDLRRA